MSRVSSFKLNIKKYTDFLGMDHASLSQYLCLIFKDTGGFKCGPGNTNLHLIFPWETSVQIPMHVKFLKGAAHPVQEKDPQI